MGSASLYPHFPEHLFVCVCVCVCASRGLLQGAACPPSLVELIFCRHAVACLSSIGPTLLFRMFSAFPDVDSKVCVCVCVCVCVLCV